MLPRRTESNRVSTAREAVQRRDVDELLALTVEQLGLDHDRPLSPHTARAYRRAIALLLQQWTGAQLLEATPDDAEAFLRAIESQEGSRSTVKVLRTGIRALYRALRAMGLVQDDPFADIQLTRPHDASTGPDPYTSAEVQVLLANASRVDRLLIRLVRDLGLPLVDCVSLRWEDLDLVRGTAHISRTGETVAIPPALRDELGSLQRRRGPVLGFATEVRARQRMTALCRRNGVRYRGILALQDREGVRTLAEAARPGQRVDERGSRASGRDADGGLHVAAGYEALETVLREAQAQAEQTGRGYGLIMLDLDFPAGEKNPADVFDICVRRIMLTVRLSDAVVPCGGARVAIVPQGLQSDAAFQGIVRRLSGVIHRHPVHTENQTMPVGVRVMATSATEPLSRVQKEADEIVFWTQHPVGIAPHLQNVG